MSDVLARIKRAVLAGHYAFSEKARLEMEADGITELDVAESFSMPSRFIKRFVPQMFTGAAELNIFT